MVNADGAVLCDFCEGQIDLFDILTDGNALTKTVSNQNRCTNVHLHKKCEWSYMLENEYWALLSMAC